MKRVRTPPKAMAKDPPMSVSVDATVPSLATSCKVSSGLDLRTTAYECAA
jgi:hypothetical protein